MLTYAARIARTTSLHSKRRRLLCHQAGHRCLPHAPHTPPHAPHTRVRTPHTGVCTRRLLCKHACHRCVRRATKGRGTSQLTSSVRRTQQHPHTRYRRHQGRGCHIRLQSFRRAFCQRTLEEEEEEEEEMTQSQTRMTTSYTEDREEGGEDREEGRLEGQQARKKTCLRARAIRCRCQRQHQARSLKGYSTRGLVPRETSAS
jgi:hypothetical protein